MSVIYIKIEKNKETQKSPITSFRDNKLIQNSKQGRVTNYFFEATGSKCKIDEPCECGKF